MRRLLILLVVFTPISFPVHGAVYTIADLGTVGAISLNNIGQVLTPSSIITNGIATPFGVPAGANNFVATGVNAPGKVVGYGTVTVSGTDIQYHNYTWNTGSFTDLGLHSQSVNVPLEYVPVHPVINDAGTIAGLINDRYAIESGATVVNLQPFDFVPHAINNSNFTVGQTGGRGSPFGEHHAAVNNGTTTTNLPDTFFYSASTATSINANGHVAGSIYTISAVAGQRFVQPEAALWVDGVLTPLGTLTNHPNEIQGPITAANAINASDQIVGVAGGGPIGLGGTYITAFIYSGGLLQDLQALIPAGSGFSLTDALSITDAGQILVTATDANFATHSLLLTPTPEPTCLGALAFGALGLLQRRRRL